ncbi:MAG: hypothetical protein ACRCVG_00680 [Methanobacteriaceae archaeon]
MSWCLYDEEIHDYGDDSSMNIYNNKTGRLTENGESFNVSVELEFEEDEKLIIFKREKHFEKYGGEIKNSLSSNLTVSEQEGEDIEISRTPQYIIERKIPEEIKNYFFFDGAKLGDYFQSHSNLKIKESVFMLSQLDLFEKVDNNLIKVRKRYVDKLKKIKPQLGRTSQAELKLENEIEELDKEIIEMRNIIPELESELKSLTDKLINSNHTDIKNIAKERRKLERDVEVSNTKITKLKEERKKLIILLYPYVLSYNNFKNMLSIGEAYRLKGFIPSKFKKSFLDDLIKEGECICGSNLSENSEKRNNIQKLRENISDITNKSEDISVALSSIGDIISEIKKFKENITKKNYELDKLESVVVKKNERIKEMGIRIKSHPTENFNKIEERLSDINDELKRKNRVIGRNESGLKMLRSKLVRITKEKTKVAALENEALELYEKINFCEKASKSAKTANQVLTEKMRKKIEKYTGQQFVKMSWKDDEFEEIMINKNYGLYIKNKSGDLERPGDLSDGEKLSLGLCFMASLHKISGFDLPIIMDTPLGNLDKEMRHNIAKFLPEFVGNKQIVLLVTGTEYTEDFRNTIYNHVGKEYVINWENSEDGKESKVVLNE